MVKRRKTPKKEEFKTEHSYGFFLKDAAHGLDSLVHASYDGTIVGISITQDIDDKILRYIVPYIISRYGARFNIDPNHFGVVIDRNPKYLMNISKKLDKIDEETKRNFTRNLDDILYNALCDFDPLRIEDNIIHSPATFYIPSNLHSMTNKEFNNWVDYAIRGYEGNKDD